MHYELLNLKINFELINMRVHLDFELIDESAF